MRKRRVMSFSSKPRDEFSEKNDYGQLLEMPFEDFQVQIAIIEILTKKVGRQFEEFQFLHSCFSETEFYSSLVRDYGIEFAFDVIQNMEYEQVDAHQNLYSETQPIQSLYFILYGNVSKVKVQGDIQKSQIVLQPEIQQYKKGEAIGQEILNLQNNSMLGDYTYVTKSRCDMAKINREYLLKKLELIFPKLQRWKEKKNISGNIMSIIKQNDLFDLVGHYDLLDIASQSQIITVNQGEYLYQKNQNCKYFYLILEGEIQIIQGFSQYYQSKPESEQSQPSNLIIQPPQPNSLISHRRAISYGGYLLNSRSNQGSPVNAQPQFKEQVLSTIGKDELLGICEYMQSLPSSQHKPQYSYSTRICSKQAKLLQIKGKVFKKLKILNSTSFYRIKKLVLEQKRVYEEREKVTEAVKLNFMRQVTEDAASEIMSLSITTLDQEKGQKASLSLQNVISNNNNNITQFHQLYSQTPYQQIQNQQKRRGSHIERLNFSRLSIDSIKNSLNSASVITKGENRSCSSSSQQVPTGNIILPPSVTTITTHNEASKYSIGLNTIENNIYNSNNNQQLKSSIQNRKYLDIFNTPSDPICQSLSNQLTEQMAKNKKRYFMQAMRELEKSSRTNPYAHQQQNSLCLQQNKSIDMLRRSPNVRERSILERYIKIKKKTEFKTDIDRREERLVRLQQLSQQQQSQQAQQFQQQQLNDVSLKLNTNITNNESINSKKQLRILPDNHFNNKLNKGCNLSKMDYYYDHPIQQTPCHDGNQNSSGKQTPIQYQDGSLYQVISEEEQPFSGNTLSNSTLKQFGDENENVFTQKKNNNKLQEIIKDENNCFTPSVGSQNVLRSAGVRTSLSSQLQNNSYYKRNGDQMVTQPLQEIHKNNDIQMNSNDSLQNINYSKLLVNKRDTNQKRRYSEQQNLLNVQYKIQSNQKLAPIHPQTKDAIQEQENLHDFHQQNELTNFKLPLNKNQASKRNQSALRSVSVKQRQSQTNNKRVLLII